MKGGWEGRNGYQSVPAGEFGHINSHPPVMGEVEKLDLAKEGSRDRRGCKPPRVGIAAEFEAGDEKADTNTGLGASDQGELLEDVRCTGSRDCDSDQTALGLCRLDLAVHAGNWDLRGGRLPVGAGREPCDGLFMGLNLGCRRLDGPGVDDRAEFHPRGVVVDILGRIGASKWLVRARNGDQLDVDMHAGLQIGADGEHGWGTRGKAAGEISGYERASDAC